MLDKGSPGPSTFYFNRIYEKTIAVILGICRRGAVRVTDGKQWYSNKDLFERIEELSRELAQTQVALKQYNGLRKKLNNVCEAVSIMQAEGAGKNKLVNGIGFIFGIIGSLVGIAGGIMAIASKM